MTAALGVLRWTPAAFWAATPRELSAALDGWAELHLPRRTGDALSDEEIATLDDMKRRFPDETTRR